MLAPTGNRGYFDGGLRTVSTEKALGVGRRREIFFLISHFGCLRVFCSPDLGYTLSAGLRGKLTGQEKGVLLEKLFFMGFNVNAKELFQLLWGSLEPLLGGLWAPQI